MGGSSERVGSLRRRDRGLVLLAHALDSRGTLDDLDPLGGPRARLDSRYRAGLVKMAFTQNGLARETPLAK